MKIGKIGVFTRAFVLAAVVGALPAGFGSPDAGIQGPTIRIATACGEGESCITMINSVCIKGGVYDQHLLKIN